MQVYCPVKPEKMDEALALMQQGIEISLSGEYDSCVILLEE